MRYPGQAANTLNFEFVWFRLKPGWPSGCFLKKLGSTVSLFPRVYFIHGEWQATILNRIEWKRNPPPKKSKVKSCHFPTLDFNGREWGINSEYIYRCLSSGRRTPTRAKPNKFPPDKHSQVQQSKRTWVHQYMRWTKGLLQAYLPLFPGIKVLI